jgi:RNA polymerase primary sigma factor
VTGKEPSDEELAIQLGLDAQEVPELRAIAQRTTSLEVPVGNEGGVELGDLIEDSNAPDPVDVVSGIITKEELAKALRRLDQRERKVVELRFGFKGERPRTLGEIGSRFNLSRERVRQIVNEALEKIAAAQRIQALESS